jgi:hypothetical protein
MSSAVADSFSAVMEELVLMVTIVLITEVRKKRSR